MHCLRGLTLTSLCLWFFSGKLGRSTVQYLADQGWEVGLSLHVLSCDEKVS